jgi:hypothetical protein
METNPADDTAELRLKLEVLRRKLAVLTNKSARAESMREIARLQWRLGDIGDDELRRVEEFADGFSYE